LLTSHFSWLIDTDKDIEGMRVIADLHGGDLHGPVAMAEFQEIKKKVQEEVCPSREISSSVSTY
jgi:hypothetical protein